MGKLAQEGVLGVLRTCCWGWGVRPQDSVSCSPFDGAAALLALEGLPWDTQAGIRAHMCAGTALGVLSVHTGVARRML